MSDELKVGQEVVITGNTVNHDFQMGETVRIKRLIEEDEYTTIIAEHLDGTDFWYISRDDFKVVFEEAEAETVAKTTRARYMYVVEDVEGEEIYKTSDRNVAREVKAAYGGKKAGVVIIAYAAVKEIR